ncbi:hypothetical protein [Saccharopolyspora flava]|uniref:Uncharacterized protein n=1 Tax=Saccharopolyspora flava TaxID=95161 RepID=A0A1I6TNW9_9PSEU|nr:hypothetical protein [Saccharopolyspora flava]SFS90923.1 hypothetical protein SAMN05660874_04154 [Saccharopolyspora flava]
MSETLSSASHDAADGRKSGNGFGIAALVVGIVACVAALFPLTSLFPVPEILLFSGPVAWLTMLFGGIIGIGLGAVGVLRAHVGKASNPTTAKVGITLSLIALIICVGWVLLNATSLPR